MQAVRAEYSYVWQDVTDYFGRYGSWPMVARSPFTHLSILVTALCLSVWLGDAWSDFPLQVLPNLLGFALAAYALLLAFGDERFRSFLAVRKSTQRTVDPIQDSLLLKVSAIFLQFVIVQIIALLLGIIGHSHPLAALHGIGWISDTAFWSWPVRFFRDVYCAFAFFMFLLSIATSANSAFNIYHATRWYVEYQVKLDRQAQDQDPPQK